MSARREIVTTRRHSTAGAALAAAALVVLATATAFAASAALEAGSIQATIWIPTPVSGSCEAGPSCLPNPTNPSRAPAAIHPTKKGAS
jgi:hypothetical protein